MVENADCTFHKIGRQFSPDQEDGMKVNLFANGDYTDHAYLQAMKGIVNPHDFNIPRGKNIFRFVDISRGPHRVVANSPWWFEFEYFQHIKHFALRHGYDLSHCARLFLAVLHEYSEITGFVSAWTALPLKAYKGRGPFNSVPEKIVVTVQSQFPCRASMKYISSTFPVLVEGFRCSTKLLRA